MVARTTRTRLPVTVMGVIALTAIVSACGTSRSDSTTVVDPKASAPQNVVPIDPGPSVPIRPAFSLVTLPIAASPSGATGSASNPLGSPGMSLAACQAQPVPISSSLAFTVSNNGFSQLCYHVAQGQSLSGVLTDNATSAESGLTIAVEIAISTVTKPVVAQQDISHTPMPGLTVPTVPIPAVNLQNAIFQSPSAPDANPISFTIAALNPGAYLVQLPTLPLVPSAILIVAGSTPSQAPAGPTTSTTIGNPGDVTVGNPSSDLETQLISSFDAWEGLPTSCQAALVPGTVKVATIKATGAIWAIARFRPAPDCSVILAPVTPGGPGRSVPPNQVGPFAEQGGPLGVFESSPNGSWIMNEEGGSPFPCPAPNGAKPGEGNGAVPSDVLAAWGLSYAENCSFVSYPPQRHG
jgi:hypothetical protein